MNEEKIEDACAEYCERAAECSDIVDAKDCTDTCTTTLTACQVRVQGEAKDQLYECAEEQCDDLLLCSVSAGAQCVFGLGF